MMSRLESLKQLIATARGNKFSALRKLVSNDEVVFNVWDMVSQWIEFNMQRQKAVNIAGLGCFSFTSKELDIGYKRYIVVHRPVFILSEKLVGIHRLNQPKHLVPGEIPVTQLNLIALANELNMHRDVVEASVKEIINAFSRQIEKRGEAELAFTTIGNLVIMGSQAKMKFLSSFLETMDKTGSLVKYFANRPDTSDSVIENDADRPPTVLPRIEPGGDLELARNDSRHCIAFEDPKQDIFADDRPAPTTPKSEPTSSRRDRSEKSPIVAVKNNLMVEPETLDGAQKKVSTPRSSLRGRCGGVVFKDPRFSPTQTPRVDSQIRLSPPVVKEATSQEQLDKHRLSKSEEPVQVPQVSSTSPRTTKVHDGKNSKSIDVADIGRLSPPRVTTRRLSLPTENEASTEKNDTTGKRVQSEGGARGRNEPKNTCDNCVTKNTDFCYLCFQREKRNVPVYFTEQRKEKESEEDRLLQMYQHLKDSESLQKERNMQNKRRECAQHDAAFNLGVAEAIKAKESERPLDYQRSFVFYKRSVSPPNWIGVEEDLREQVAGNKQRRDKESRDKCLLERIEQLQLTKDLELQRKHYLQQKKLQSEEYRKALDTQLNFRSAQLPAAEPDSDGPVFGVHDSTQEKLDDNRQRARDLYQNQVAMAREKENKKKESNRKKQVEEEDMLRKTRKELMSECCHRNERNLSQRRRLEESWAKNAHMKRVREQHEADRTKSPGLLVLEQCEQYDRCAQCCRRANNCGESNVWSESRYVAGSRLIV